MEILLFEKSNNLKFNKKVGVYNKYQYLWCIISTIRLIMEYIFIIKLFEDANIDIFSIKPVKLRTIWFYMEPGFYSFRAGEIKFL